MADNSQSEISAVQRKRPRLEQDEHISSSSASFNVPVLNTQFENANSNNLSENCSSSVDDVRPTHQASSSVPDPSMPGARPQENAPCSSNRPSIGGPDDRSSTREPTVPTQAQHDGNDTSSRPGTDHEPSSSSTATVNQHPSIEENKEDMDDSDQDLDLNLGNWTPQPAKGPLGWLQQQMMIGVNPRSILCKVFPGTDFPEGMDECQLWALLVEYFEYLSEPKRRVKQEAYNTMDDVVRLLQSCTKVLVLTGAGVSVSCGIPDFRSRDGIYARLSQDFPDLPDPQSMFDIHYFRRDPRPFFKFAKEIYPGQFKPSVNHQFISVLEQQGKLLRNYTQNIDTLEQVAGISKVIQCHGSFASASCTRCKHKVNADAIRQDIFNQVVPLCPNCPQDGGELAVMKPDIVFFGEGLPNTFYESLDDDKTEADLLIVIGSSLKVRPVATIPNMLPHDIPQILINREPLPHMTFDIELLGDSDIIVNELCRRLGDGWNHICHSDEKLEESLDMPLSAKMLFETMPTPPYSQGECEENSQDVNDATATAVNQAADLPDDVFHQECKKADAVTELPAGTESQNCTNSLPHQTDSVNPPVEEHLKEEADITTESSSIEGGDASNVESQPQNSLMEKASSSSSLDFKEKDSSVEESPVKITVGKKKTHRRYSRDSIATCLKPSTFLFIPPNRYIFHGAEVYPDSDSEEDSFEQNSSLNTSSNSTNDPKSATVTDATSDAAAESSAFKNVVGLVPDATKSATVTDATSDAAAESNAFKNVVGLVPDATVTDATSKAVAESNAFKNVVGLVPDATKSATVTDATSDAVVPDASKNIAGLVPDAIVTDATSNAVVPDATKDATALIPDATIAISENLPCNGQHGIDHSKQPERAAVAPENRVPEESLLPIIKTSDNATCEMTYELSAETSSSTTSSKEVAKEIVCDVMPLEPNQKCL